MTLSLMTLVLLVGCWSSVDAEATNLASSATESSGTASSDVGASATQPRVFWSRQLGIQPNAQPHDDSGLPKRADSSFNFMLDIYKQRSYQVRDSPEVADQRKDEGRCQRPESTVIHLFPVYGKKPFILWYFLHESSFRPHREK